MGSPSNALNISRPGLVYFDGAYSFNGRIPISSNNTVFFNIQTTTIDFTTSVQTSSGTFSPVVLGEGGNPTITYTDQIGRYYQIGSMVQFNITIGISAMSGGSGNALIGNLPLLSENITNQFTIFLGTYNSTDLSQIAPASFYLGANSNTMFITQQGSVVTVDDLESAVSSSITNIYVSGVYRI